MLDTTLIIIKVLVAIISIVFIVIEIRKTYLKRKLRKEKIFLLTLLKKHLEKEKRNLKIKKEKKKDGWL